MNAGNYIALNFSLDGVKKLARYLLSIYLGLISCGSLIAFGQEEPSFPMLYAILVENRASSLPSYRLADDKDLREAVIMRRGRRLPVTPNMALQQGDNIRTGPSLAFAIRFPNGSQLYLRPNTDVIIGSVFALVGELFVRVKGAFQVDTDFVTAGAEGTAWVMKVLPGGDTRCTVLEGRVRVSSQQNAWRPLVVTPNRVTLTRQSKSAETLLASRQDLDAMLYWIRQIDRFAPQTRPQTGDSYPPVPLPTEVDSYPRRPHWESGERRPRWPDRDWPHDSKPRIPQDSTEQRPRWPDHDSRHDSKPRIPQDSTEQRPRWPDRDSPLHPRTRDPHSY